jgi:hypothetical protein
MVKLSPSKECPMSQKRTTKSEPAKSAAKVGSDPDAAHHVGGAGDFGVRADNRIGREYASREIKQQDPTNEVARSGGPEQPDDQGSRTSGVGGNASGVGSSSGGDIDPDYTGVIGSFAQAGPDDRTDGPDMLDQGDVEREASRATRDAMQSGTRASGDDAIDQTAEDASTALEAQGSAAVTNPARGDDSFAGEISNDEASGADEER